MGETNLGDMWPCLDRKDCVRLRTAAVEWNVPMKHGPYGELFYFLIQKEPMPGKETVDSFFEPDFCRRFSKVVVSNFVVDYLADEGMKPSDVIVLGSGGTREFDGPETLLRESVAEALSENESLSTISFRQNNVCNIALQIIGLDGSDDKMALFFKDRELAKVALSRHIALDMLCHKMHDTWAHCCSGLNFLSPWTGCNRKGDGCGERNEGRRNAVGESFGVRWACQFLSKFDAIETWCT